MTQTQAILKHLKSGRYLTPLEALERFQCFRLAARIGELRQAGHPIGTATTKTRSGKRIAAYFLGSGKE